MCRRVTCSSCGKYTWAGCGLHIQSALAGLTEDQICQCNKDSSTKDKQNNNQNDDGIISKIKTAIGF
ncbi:hypothetical protein BJ944DRAFT_258608 [Cunninghamella echinulata]|nr:hypothetical protein BJ944DRAFT_258608 [Cunninghamella echinulata]